MSEEFTPHQIMADWISAFQQSEERVQCWRNNQTPQTASPTPLATTSGQTGNARADRKSVEPTGSDPTLSEAAA